MRGSVRCFARKPCRPGMQRLVAPALALPLRALLHRPACVRDARIDAIEIGFILLFIRAHRFI
ncbi:hypothetical protein DF133_25170 [Burkholderia cenocepacia]|nr:hypothetical protein DF133_25170 [Burkholderia cenocepacia]RQV64635.1 hypothetical protein DF024_12750 [Burkholderia cenocepacia]